MYDEYEVVVVRDADNNGLLSWIMGTEWEEIINRLHFDGGGGGGVEILISAKSQTRNGERLETRISTFVLKMLNVETWMLSKYCNNNVTNEKRISIQKSKSGK